MRVNLVRLATIGLVASILNVPSATAVAASPEFSDTSDAIWMTDGAGKVLSLAEGGNRVFIGGSFTGMRATYDGATVDQRFISSVDMWTGGLLAAFDPDVDDEVRAVAVSPDAQTVYIGGRFESVNGHPSAKLAALDAVSGDLKPGFNVTIPAGIVEAIAVDSAGDLFVGGSFSLVNGQRQKSLAKLDGSTGALIGWDANMPAGKVKSLLLTKDEARLYIGTSVDDEDGVAMDGELRAVDPGDASLIDGFSAGTIDRPVLDMAVTESKIYLAMGGGGGRADILNVSNGSRRERFSTDGDVQAVEVVGDRAYFAGHWTERFGSHSSFRFVAIDIDDDSVDQSYYPRLTGLNGVHDLLHDGFHLWMGGHITDANPVSRRGYARYAPVGSGAPLTSLVESGARWKYLDDGSEPGTGWRTLGYDDSAWRYGRSELGYGDGDESRVIRGGPKGDRHITTYFRRDVATYDHDDIGYVEIRLKRDDGVVVYINGVEVVRDNLPTGTIDGETPALLPIVGDAEDTWTRWIVDPAVLVEGDNILAAEIHQDSPTSKDISFDFELLVDTRSATFVAAGARWQYRDDGPDLATGWRRVNYNDAKWKTGRAQLGYGEGDEARVIKYGPANDRHITTYFRRPFSVYDVSSVSTLKLELLRDDGAVVYLNQVEVVRSNMPDGPIDSEVAASPVGGSAEQKWLRYSLDPGLLVEGENILAVEIHQSGPKNKDHSFDARLALQVTPEELIRADSKWRYSDNGKARLTNWRKIGFKAHSNWPVGAAELGYGDGDEATVINSGPAGDRLRTAYFRRIFRVTDPGVFSVLEIGLVRDDGAVVYLNGVEVLRDNMPSGQISFDTFANSGASNEDTFSNFSVPATMLVEGRNVVAVEVHQAGPGSSDLSFNLRLSGR